MNVCLTVSEGIITSAKIFGDFFGISDIAVIEKALCGVVHREADVLNVLKKHKISDYFGKISAEELIKVLI